MRALRQARMPAPIVARRRRGAGCCATSARTCATRRACCASSPASPLAAVLTLALGIGANTAIFSLVNATLLQRLPVQDRERLVYVFRGTSGVLLVPALRDAARRTPASLDGLAAWGGITASLNAGRCRRARTGVIVTGNFFDVLGCRRPRGRLLSAADDVTPGAHPVAVISHDFWQTRFGGRPDIVGRDVRLNGHVFTIVGVARRRLPGPQLGSTRDSTCR